MATYVMLRASQVFQRRQFHRHKRSKAVLPATRARVEATIAQLGFFPDELTTPGSETPSGELFIGATYFWRG